MQKLLKIIFLSLIIVSCENHNTKNNEKKISLKEFPVPETNIRALDVIDTSKVWYAGSNEKFGFIKDNFNLSLELDSIPRGEEKYHFRGIKKNGDDLFLLSIEKPAGIIKFNQGTKFVYRDSLNTAFYDAINFWNNKEGLVMGDPQNNCLTILKTVDGGNSWNKIACENIPPMEEGEAAFAASNSNIVLKNNTAWIVTGGKKSRVLKSTDKGETWTSFDTPIVQGKETTGIYTADFYDENVGIVMGGDYTDKPNKKANKAITKDGGKTWQLVANDKLPGYISSVKFVPNSKGQEIVAVSTEGIYYTKNQGADWQKVSDQGYFSVQFADSKIAWLGGVNKIAKLTLN
ncbi:WD40/YVTN/BNR-like repeat-containing protein [Aureivirga sp. CE67]|uniref:WD40/YVTN/BNR-like repeat-containing protein n=1 Tax=Aureivirga sp. CE67 TaxID=1788983 RepID=UPI0018C922A4|nr:oxidoreductase [Aureivirga sp. CE67]